MIDTDEATNRTMDRMMASARYGRQKRAGEYTELVVNDEAGREVSVSFGPDTIEAILLELEAGAPCGVCHSNPCSWRSRGSDS